MTHHRPWSVLLLSLALVVGAACSGDDDTAEKQRPSDTAESVTDGPDTVEVAVLADGSRYVQGLCSINFFDPDDTDDPIGWLIDQLEELPTDTPEETDEVEWMIERLERSEELDDPLDTDDLDSVAAILGARCSP